MASHIAKNNVATEHATESEVQLSYAIGVSEPVSVLVQADGVGGPDNGRLADIVREVFPLKPKEMIDYLDLRRPIYKRTARHGHFGREEEDFTWERSNRLDDLHSAAGL
jgi:S-adenosylmethionine synthetase